MVRRVLLRSSIAVMAVVLGCGYIMAQSLGQSAATAPVARIAVIDTQKVFTDSVRGQQILRGLKEMQAKFEADLAVRLAEVQALEKRAQAAAADPAPARDALAKQARDARAAYDLRKQELTREIEARKEKDLATLDQFVMPVINKMGAELGYSAIFRKFESGLIYADQSIDLTALVVRRIDQLQQ